MLLSSQPYFLPAYLLSQSWVRTMLSTFHLDFWLSNGSHLILK